MKKLPYLIFSLSLVLTQPGWLSGGKKGKGSGQGPKKDLVTGDFVVSITGDLDAMLAFSSPHQPDDNTLNLPPFSLALDQFADDYFPADADRCFGGGDHIVQTNSGGIIRFNQNDYAMRLVVSFSAKARDGVTDRDYILHVDGVPSCFGSANKINHVPQPGTSCEGSFDGVFSLRTGEPKKLNRTAPGCTVGNGKTFVSADVDYTVTQQ